MTRKLEVLYDSPVILGTTYDLAARVIRTEGRKLFMEAGMEQLGGSRVASASHSNDNGSEFINHHLLRWCTHFLSVDVAHFNQGMPR